MEFIKGRAKNVKMKYYKKQGNETVEKNYTTSDDTNVTVNSQFYIEKQKITFTKRRGFKNIDISNDDEVIIVGNMANNVLIGVNYHNFTKNKSEFMSKKTAFFYFLFSIVCLTVFATICYMDFAKSVNVAMYALACFSLLFSIISFSIFKTGNNARILLHEQTSEKNLMSVDKKMISS